MWLKIIKSKTQSRKFVCAEIYQNLGSDLPAKIKMAWTVLALAPSTIKLRAATLKLAYCDVCARGLAVISSRRLQGIPVVLHGDLADFLLPYCDVNIFLGRILE